MYCLVWRTTIINFIHGVYWELYYMLSVRVCFYIYNSHMIRMWLEPLLNVETRQSQLPAVTQTDLSQIMACTDFFMRGFLLFHFSQRRTQPDEVNEMEQAKWLPQHLFWPARLSSRKTWAASICVCLSLCLTQPPWATTQPFNPGVKCLSSI